MINYDISKNRRLAFSTDTNEDEKKAKYAIRINILKHVCKDKCLTFSPVSIELCISYVLTSINNELLALNRTHKTEILAQ